MGTYTVFPHVNAYAFISYLDYKSRCLIEVGIYSVMGVYQ